MSSSIKCTVTVIKDPSTRVVSDTQYSVYDPRTGIYSGEITVQISEDGLTTTNETVSGRHPLHDGVVSRYGYRDAYEDWNVVTHGYGNNVIPGMNVINSWQGEKVFDHVDKKMRDTISRERGLKL